MLSHFLVSDLGVGDRHGQAGVLRQFKLGPNVDLGGENQLLVVFEFSDLNLRLPDGDDLVLGDRGVVGGWEGLVDRLLQNGPPANALVDHSRGDLAFAESGNGDLRTDPGVGRREGIAHLLERDLNGELDAGGRQGLDRTLHKRSSGVGAHRDGFPGGLVVVRAVGSNLVGAGRLELPISCSQSRRASHYATPRGNSSVSLTAAPEPAAGRGRIGKRGMGSANKGRRNRGSTTRSRERSVP